MPICFCFLKICTTLSSISKPIRHLLQSGQPGGKIEPGEDAHSALIREFREELNLELSQEELTPPGEFTDAPLTLNKNVPHVWPSTFQAICCRVC
ncbi:NUDIX domain-containing protein [Pantoea phytobeneficialis]|uniref:NUDIX domain-containing protein n=1 Tax=Pantoea phytobeneficialis TaxID=2052056 RepID=A0AAP9HAU5_9GAMM|nr:NUDIX domain-containing protein [Pantoea phytobeneficialis]MDO6406520.1 NUDIX domain-containing protein [Pantoea phytobeneficialis]QGR09617.1 hypothetical protein CTZ24_24435 [Pantoea phytobeneficialis]